VLRENNFFLLAQIYLERFDSFFEQALFVILIVCGIDFRHISMRWLDSESSIVFFMKSTGTKKPGVPGFNFKL
jgi:hypothetical protein